MLFSLANGFIYSLEVEWQLLPCRDSQLELGIVSRRVS